MKTKSKNFVNRRSLYLSFGLFNQIRDTRVTKNTTKSTSYCLCLH